MRYVPTYCLRKGMVVGKDIYGNNNQILLRKGTEIAKNYIQKLKKYGFNGIYVDDSLSCDIEIKEIIDEKLRYEATKSLKDVFIMTDKNPENKERHKKLELLQLQIENIINDIIENKNLMINMVDLKTFDDYTFAHSVNVAILSIVIGISLDLNKDKLYRLGLGAFLHDIGKVFVGTEIVNKPAKLTADEFLKMKMHSEYGYDYLKKEFGMFAMSYKGVLDHHEKYDGTGYPANLKGDKISLFGRIIAIADVYDALISERPYRKGMLPSEAIEFIMSNSGLHFDPEIVRIFLRKVAPYPLGTCVKLSNGLIGIVIENYEDSCLRPKVRIFEENSNPVEEYEICLTTDRKYLNVIIEEIVNR